MHERSEPPERASITGTSVGREPVQRWRLVVRRAALAAEATQREQLTAWEDALAATGLPVAGLDAARAKPRFSMAAPLAAGIPGEGELVDLWLVERLPIWRVREAVAASLPRDHALVDLYDVWLGEAPLPGRVAASVYRVVLGSRVDPVRFAAAAASLIAADALPRDRRKGDGTVRYDLRPFLLGLQVEPGPGAASTVRMTLRHDPERGVGRPDEALAALAEVLGDGPLVTAAVVRERLLLAEAPPPEPAAPRGPRSRPATRQGDPERAPRADKGRR